MIFFRLLLLVFPLSMFAQQETLATFIIKDARINKQDYTNLYLNAGGYISFYKDKGVLCMANVMSKRNSQSYGKLDVIDYEKINPTKNNYETEIYYFKWSYYNTYDTDRGSANVRLVKIYKPQGVAFICTIVAEDLDVLEYKGYMNGSLDFSKFR